MNKEITQSDSEELSTIGIKIIGGAFLFLSVIVYDIIKNNITIFKGIDIFVYIISACFNPIAWIGIALFISAYKESVKFNKADIQDNPYTATKNDIKKITRFRFVFFSLVVFIAISTLTAVLVEIGKTSPDFTHLWTKYYSILQLFFFSLNVWYLFSLYQNSKALKKCNIIKARPVFLLLLSLIPYFNIITGIIIIMKSNKFLKSNKEKINRQ